MKTTKDASSEHTSTPMLRTTRTLTMNRLRKVSRFHHRFKPYPVVVIIASGISVAAGLIQVLATLVGPYG